MIWRYLERGLAILCLAIALAIGMGWRAPTQFPSAIAWLCLGYFWWREQELSKRIARIDALADLLLASLREKAE